MVNETLEHRMGVRGLSGLTLFDKSSHESPHSSSYPITNELAPATGTDMDDDKATEFKMTEKHLPVVGLHQIEHGEQVLHDVKIEFKVRSVS